MYVVRTGHLEVIRDDVVVQELGRGAAIGELGLLTASPRAASIRARRDCQLLRITSAQFDAISAAEPVFLKTVAATVARWVQTSRPRQRRSRAAVIAVVGLDAAANPQRVASEVIDGLERHDTVLAPTRLTSNGLERAEAAFDRVVLLAMADDDEDWRSFCLRQADRIILVSSASRAPSEPIAVDDERDRPRSRRRATTAG